MIDPNGQKRRGRLQWAIPLGIVLALAALILLAPQFANLESARNKLSQLLEERVGARIQFGKMELSYLPLPHLRVRGVSLALPGGEKGYADAVGIFPRLFPLLQGKVRIARVEVDSFRMKLLLPKPRGGEVHAAEIFRLFLAPLALQESDLKMILRQGSLEAQQEGGASLVLTEVAAEVTLPPEGFSFRISCVSNLWEGAILEGRLDTQALKGEGNLNLKGFQAGLCLDFLVPSSSIRLADSFLDLGFSFRVEGLQEIQAELEGAFPEMTLLRAGNRALLKSGRFSAAAVMGANGISFSLKDLSLEEPKLAALGELTLGGGGDGGIKIRLEGRDVDIPAARERVLSIVGEEPGVRKTFDVLRAGIVPGVVFESAADSLSGLLDLENLVIAGRLEEGQVHVPGVDLELGDVKGEAILSEGILEATSLEAKDGNTRGENGTLKLGLKGEDAPFQLDIQVQADLSEVQPVLKRMVTHKVFRSEMDKILEVQGKASGRLVLGDRLSEIRARVEASEFELSARHEAIPHPVALQGKGYRYEGTTSHVSNLQCQVGRSSASGISLSLDWAQEPRLTAELRRGRLFVEEVLSWISSMGALRGGLEELADLGGELLLAETRVSGPLEDPAEWRFEVNGEIPDLHGQVAALPAPVRLTGGRFAANQRKLVLRDVEARFMDSALTVSGSLDGTMHNPERGDLTVRGEVGAQAIGEYTRFSWQGKPLHVRSAVSLEPMRISWERDRSLGFSGKAAVRGGPTVTLDVQRTGAEWIADKVLVQDQDSDAHISFRFHEPELTLAFRGELNEKTLDRIFPGYEAQQGWVKGDMQVHLVRDRMKDCWARGRLTADDFSVLHLLPASLDLDEISLHAEGRRIGIESLTFTWAQTRFSAKGSLEARADGLLADMDFHCSVFDWAHVRPYLPFSDDAARTTGRGWVAGFPLMGSVRVHFDRFIHAGFAWSPLKANALFGRKKVEAWVTEAEVCGISTPGSVVATPESLVLRFQALAKDQDVSPSVECLSEGRRRATGRFDLRLDLQGKGKEKDILSSLQGSLVFSARQGRILEHILFERINHYLSLSGIIRPDQEYGSQGIAFDSVVVKAGIQNGQCTIQEAVFDGVDLDAGFQGRLDLVKGTIDGTLLVAPFRTGNRIIRFVPLVRTVMGRTLVSVPIKVEGPLGDPKLTALAPSAVGKSLVDMMRRTFTLPVQIFDPLIHKRSEQP